MAMDIYYSDLCLLGGDLAESLETLAAYGGEKVEIMMDGASWDFFETRHKELLSILRHSGLPCSLHAPCWDVNLTSESSHIRAASLQSALDAIAFAAELECHHLVIHPGFCQTPVFHRQKAKSYGTDALRRLCEAARNAGVRLAVENVGYHGSCLYTYEEFIHLLDEIGPEAGYLLDVGHAILNGWSPAQAIRDLGDRLLAVHLHDNDGATDSHLPIGQGAIPWSELAEEIGRLPDSCSLVLEYNYGAPLEALPQAKQQILSLWTPQ